MQQRCKATTRSGEQCGNPPMIGGRVCRMHGGASKSVREASRRRQELNEARRQLVALGEPEDIDPAQALLQLISWKYGEVKWLRQRVEETPEDQLTWGLTQTRAGLGVEGPIDEITEKAAPSVWWVLLREAEGQLADYATKALRAGVEERRVRMAEAQGDLVYKVMMAVFNRLQLTPAQWSLVRVAAPEELRRLGSD